ncbi:MULTISPECIES: YadA-like family protein [Acinetobacter]|uniref:Cell surface protein n=1 Tax=Acinetobacter higginsii TaxID=70347 RepID=N9RLS8_9GAMM|nr:MULTISPECIES: YadA-like family protein [Acinetobacter]ENX58919.1 hypothetical protein F902_01546 [Acinetobacter higginsii]
MENKGLNFAGNAGADVHRKLGEKLNIVGGADAATAEDKTSGENVITRTTADGIKVELLKDAKFDSITTGDTVLNDKGVTIKDGPSITKDGINAGDKVISNVADGSIAKGSKDAVNGGQIQNISDSIKNSIGGNTTVNKDGSISTNNIGGTGKDNINDAIKSVDDKVTTGVNDLTNKGLNFAGNAGADVHRKLGEKLNIVGGADAATAEDKTSGENVITRTTADGIKVELLKDAKFDSITTGDTVLNDKGVIIKDGPSITKDGINAGNKVISNVADGVNGKDAVNVDQLTKVKDGLDGKITDTNTKLDDAKKDLGNQITDTNNKLDDAKKDLGKQGQETTDRLTIGQTVQKMNTDGIKFFHTNADTSKGDLGATNDSSAGGINSTAIGVNAIVSTGADSAVALGHNSKAGGKESIAIGQGAEASGLQSISIGTGNKVKGDHSGAIGDPTIVDGANSYSVGNNNQVLTNDTFVLGNNVTKTVAGSVVLGNGSAATTGAGVAGYALSAITSADKTAIDKTTSTTGAVAVGDAASGIYRQITGVAAGSDDADAVNVAQLKAVGNQVVKTQTALVDSLGGGAKVNNDGTITGPTYNVAQGNQTNVGDALTALDKAIGSVGTTSKTTVTNGQNIVVNKSKNADGSDNYEVATAKDLTVDSVKAGDTVLNNAGITIGNNTVVLNNTGLIIDGGPSVTTKGIDAGNKQVINVAAGTKATDAVNKGQLDSAISNVNNTVNELANNAVKYDDANKDKVTLGGGANGTTITNVKDGTVAQGSKDAVNGGQLWNVQKQVDQNSTDIQNINNNISNINNGKSGLVQQQTANGEITVGKDTGGTSVNVAGKDGDRVVTGVKDGAISATSKDAVNGSQLNATNKKVVEFLGGGAGYDNITNSFTNPTYNVGGKDYNNVGGAVDALNKADQALNSKIDNVSNRLEQAFYSTNQRIDDVEKKANAGIAAAMALEAAPYIAGKYTYSAGASYHGGENAVGVTLRKTADNGRWSITGGVAAASQGDPSVRIGISGVID